MSLHTNSTILWSVWSGQVLIGHIKSVMENIVVSSGLISLRAFIIKINYVFLFVLILNAMSQMEWRGLLHIYYEIIPFENLMHSPTLCSDVEFTSKDIAILDNFVLEQEDARVARGLGS